MSSDDQSFATHRKFVPAYHCVLFPIVLLNVIGCLVGIYRTPGLGSLWSLVMAVALVATVLYARVFALKAQDRVIRLEERIRMRELLPDSLTGRLGELRLGQFVGLRFASDAELPDLVRQALDEKLGGEEIKKRIKTWRGDVERV